MAQQIIENINYTIYSDDGSRIIKATKHLNGTLTITSCQRTYKGQKEYHGDDAKSFTFQKSKKEIIADIGKLLIEASNLPEILNPPQVGETYEG